MQKRDEKGEKNGKFVQIRGNGKNYGRKDENLEDYKVQLRCYRFGYEHGKNVRERKLEKGKFKENWGVR